MEGDVVSMNHQIVALECRAKRRLSLLLLHLPLHAALHTGLACADHFDSAVVFSRFSWIGTAIDNPSDAPLPMPAHVFTMVCPCSASLRGPNWCGVL